MFRSWGQTSQVLGVRLIRPWITYIILGSFVSKLILELLFNSIKTFSYRGFCISNIMYLFVDALLSCFL